MPLPTLQILRNSTPSLVPSSLLPGQLALNRADGLGVVVVPAGVASINGQTGTMSITAGANVSVTSSGAGNVTISSSGGGGGGTGTGGTSLWTSYVFA